MNKYFFVISLIFTRTVFANLGDHFGSSPLSMGLAGQASFQSDPSDNHYGASLLKQTDKNQYSINFFAMNTQFKPIKDVVVASPVNSANNNDQIGNIDTDYKNQYLYALHGSLRLFKSIPSKLNLSVYLPTEKFLETSTGDPYRPEYVMYRSRFQRTLVLANINYQLENIGFSIGGISGFQSKGETYVVARETGSDNPPSSGKLSFNARPSMALIISMAIDHHWGEVYFTFQDEMKNELENNASGYTPIGSSSLKYDWDLSTMLYYDPRIYRLGSNWLLNSSWNLITTLEYQDWSGYETPILEMKNNGGFLLGSETQKNFKTQNILIPKLGTLYHYKQHTWAMGISYRPSPLELKQNQAGNSVDTDALVFGLAHQFKFNFNQESFSFNWGLQYHQLKHQTIKNSGSREDGTSGQKIGAPSYTIGGEVFTVSFGVNWLI